MIHGVVIVRAWDHASLLSLDVLYFRFIFLLIKLSGVLDRLLHHMLKLNDFLSNLFIQFILVKDVLNCMICHV